MFGHKRPITAKTIARKYEPTTADRFNPTIGAAHRDAMHAPLRKIKRLGPALTDNIDARTLGGTAQRINKLGPRTRWQAMHPVT